MNEIPLATEENIFSQTLEKKIDELNAHAKELQNDPAPEGQQVAEEALALAEKENYQKGIAEALCTLGWRSYRKGNFTLMLEQSERALALAEKVGNTAVEARACNTIGSAYHATGNYNKALEYYLRLLAIREETNDNKGIAVSLGSIGNVYNSTGDYSKALEYYMRSLTMKEETGDQKSIAVSLINIGNVYRKAGDYSKALEYSLRARAICEETGDKHTIAGLLTNIGTVYYSTDDYSKALEYQMRSHTIQEKIGNKHGIAMSLGSIGTVYDRTGEYGKALEYYLRALAIQEEICDKYGVGASLGNIGKIYAAQESDGYDTAKAREYLSKALAIAEEIGAKDSVFETHQSLAVVYEQMGDMAKAYEHFKKYHEIEKEVHSEEYLKKRAQLEQQQEIALMQQEQKLTYNLLNKIFPRSVVNRLRDGESPLADYYPTVSVLFLDLVNFTALSSKIPSRQLLYLLNSIFDACDEVVDKHGLEKIKTIGDAYMAASGVPEQREDHLERAAQCALDLVSVLDELTVNMPAELGDKSWIKDVGRIAVRIGLHTGEAVGGVIGKNKFSMSFGATR